MITRSMHSPRKGLSVNDGSSAGAHAPKEAGEIRESKDAAMRAWALANVEAVAKRAQALTARIESPDVSGEERTEAKRQRAEMMGRLRAMQRLLT